MAESAPSKKSWIGQRFDKWLYRNNTHSINFYPNIPDYKIYKPEEVPQLVVLQKKLAAHGLKDPWIRNEVWRYHPGFGTSTSKNVRQVFFKGFWPGVLLALGAYYIEQKYYPSDHHHDEDGH